MLPDGELLRRYAEEGSQAAFTELVQRHVNAIYRAALRRVGGNAHAADDVVQRVFADLARKARSLRGRPSLAGWLHTGTRFAAADAVRSERRRRLHEAEAHAAREIPAEGEPPLPSSRLEPVLDQALDALPERDREAVLLHFLEGKSFVEIGSALSLSPDAARMRVNRALDRLRAGVASRGVTSSAAALSAALSLQRLPALSPSHAAAIARRALERAAASGAAAAAKLSSLAWWGGAAAAVALGWLAFRGAQNWHRSPAAPPAAAMAGLAQAETPAPPEGAPGSGPGPAEAAPPSGAVSPHAGAASPAAEAFPGFQDLSEAEKHILKSLWRPDRRVSLHVGARAPNAADFAAGRAPLAARGWIELTPDSSTARLSPAGLEFCRMNQAAIAAYPAFYQPLHRAPDPALVPPAAGPFLSTP